MEMKMDKNDGKGNKTEMDRRREMKTRLEGDGVG